MKIQTSCTFKWFNKLCLVGNAFLHSDRAHANGFSPVCVLLCVFKWWLAVKAFPHPSSTHLGSREKKSKWISNAMHILISSLNRRLLVWSFLSMGADMFFEVTQGCEVFTAASVATIESISTMKSLVGS